MGLGVGVGDGVGLGFDGTGLGRRGGALVTGIVVGCIGSSGTVFFYI